MQHFVGNVITKDPAIFLLTVLRRNKMKKFILVAVALMFSQVAVAGMYKCKGDDGSVVYQESPCTGGNSNGGQVQTPKSASSSALSPETRKASNNEFQSAMASHNYDKALMFATNDQQRARAQNMKTGHDTRCAELQIRAQQAEANQHHHNGQMQHAAEAAQAIYNVECH
jgi:hypothetical protein